MLALIAVAAVPLARGSDTFQSVDVRVAAVAFAALVAAIVHGWSGLVAVAVALVAGGYAVELTVDDAPLDLAAPAVAVGSFLAAELAYWSLDERGGARGDAEQNMFRGALVALAALAVFGVTGGLLVVIDEVRVQGLALDLAGALAAVAALLVAVTLARVP